MPPKSPISNAKPYDRGTLVRNRNRRSSYFAVYKSPPWGFRGIEKKVVYG